MEFSYSEVIDLTMPIVSGMDIPCGIRSFAPSVKFDILKHSETDGIQVGAFTAPIHAGTHLDTPKHVLPNGKTLEQVDLNMWMGKGTCIDLSFVKPNEEITVEMLKPYEDKLWKGMVLFLYTGWNEKMAGTQEYWDDSPTLGKEAGEWLSKKIGVKFLGYDFFQDAGAKGFKTNVENFLEHKAVLGNGTVHVEHLTNLSKVVGTEFFAIGLPLNIIGAEGSPTRVVALR